MRRNYKVASKLNHSACEVYQVLMRHLGGEFAVSVDPNLDDMLTTSKTCKDGNPKTSEEVCSSLEATKEQPSVPVQFIYYEDEKRLCYYDHAMGVAGNGDGFVKNCTVEQIGAVLYVRGE